jgi:hypothetical protein
MEGPRRRPGALTGAAWALIVSGALTALVGLVVASSEGSVSTVGLEGDTGSIFAAVFLAIGGIRILAGVLILRLSGVGRGLGFIVAGIGVIGGLAQLSGAAGSALITLVVDGFVLWALATNGEAFRSRG